MQYEFEAPDGSVVLVEYPMGKAPPIGGTVKIGGETMRRLPSVPRVDVRRDGDTPWKFRQLHPDEAGQVGRAAGHRHYDSLGNPVFTTKGERKAFQKVYNRRADTYGTERLVWDDEG